NDLGNEIIKLSREKKDTQPYWNRLAEVVGFVSENVSSESLNAVQEYIYKVENAVKEDLPELNQELKIADDTVSIEEISKEIEKEKINQINLYRYGDFYEAFNEEATAMANALNLHTAKNTNGDIIVGIPQHTLTTNIELLKNADFEVNTFEHRRDEQGVQIEHKSDDENNGTQIEHKLSTENSAFQKAFRDVRINHDFHNFSYDAKILLERIQKIMENSDITIFKDDLFNQGALRNVYGNAERVNEKYFNGELSSIQNEINSALNENTIQQIIDRTSSDLSVINAVGNSDRENTEIEVKEKIKQIMNDMLSENTMEFADFYNYFFDKLPENTEIIDNIISIAAREFEDIQRTMADDPYIYVPQEDISENQGVQIEHKSDEIQITDNNSLERAKQVINEFCNTEFNSNADFTDLHNVNIAYTTLTDYELPVQITVDLVDFEIKHDFDGEIFETEKYSSLEDILENGLTGLDFSELVYVPQDIQDNHTRELNTNENQSVQIEHKSENTRTDTPEYNVGDHIEIDTGRNHISGTIVYKSDLEINIKHDNGYSWEYSVLDRNTIDEKLKQDTQNNYITPKPTNFHITDNNLGIGTVKEKYENNINAIKTLQKIEKESRNATAEEQEILSKYVGWGGLADAFDNSKTAWAKEYTELKNLLSPYEYDAARASTLNAHYTSPTIINAMYETISNMGFNGGKILEPAMGIGNFFGAMPKDLQDNSKLYGVELDSISGRIAKHLYPKADIQINGFEIVNPQSNSFDVAIGNVPFGNYRLYDKDFKKGELIHDYFFKKSLDKVKPNGIVAFITSKGTMDKQDNSVRKYLAERADLLGAVRLPNTAFKSNAGTEVVSDIIFLQKRETIRDFEKEQMPDWVNVSEIDKELYTEKSLENNSKIFINNYFKNNPEMVAGDLKVVSSQYGFDITCDPKEDADFSEILKQALSNIKGEFSAEISQEDTEIGNNLPNNDIIPENYRNFCYHIIDNDIYYRENNVMQKQDIDGKKAERLKGMIEISSV
ncbi:MAG: hypothetical protein IJ583_11015, partial [Firmicutes bacterium]|nr:hypothetical protein [Bacillota bacterium]